MIADQNRNHSGHRESLRTKIHSWNRPPCFPPLWLFLFWFLFHPRPSAQIRGKHLGSPKWYARHAFVRNVLHDPNRAERIYRNSQP